MNNITYKYVPRKQLKASRKHFTKIMIDLHHSLRNDYGISFEDRLIGSAGRKFVLKEEPANRFDFDFNLVVHKKNGHDKPNQLHEVFEEGLFDYRDKYNKDHPTNKMIITPKDEVFTMEFEDDSIRYSCDIAIIEDHSDENGKWEQHILVRNSNGEYIYNQREHVDFSKDIKEIKAHRDNVWLRDKYLDKKNDPNEQDKKSYQIFAEALHEILDSYN